MPIRAVICSTLITLVCSGEVYARSCPYDTYSVYVDPKGDSFTYASMTSRSGNLAVGSERRVGKQVK
jgi:hypothetical protein